MRALKSYGLALILLLIATGWLLTGTLVRGGYGPEEGEISIVSAIEHDGGPLTAAVERSGLAVVEHHHEGIDDPALSIAERSIIIAQAEGEARSVRVQTFSIKPMKLEVPLRGYTAATASVVAVAESSGIVETVNVYKGQTVKKDELICTLDQGTRQANVANAQADLVQAEAALGQAKTEFNANENLRLKGLASANSGDSFKSALRSAEATIEARTIAVRNAERELDKTEVRASMGGVILNDVVEAGAYLNIGGACAHILQLDPMVFVGAVPQTRINLARLGMEATITTINGQTAQGKVSFISPSANAATRTFEIEIEFPNTDGQVFDGVSAQASVDMGTIPAHLLPQSLLTLDGNGTLGVRAVEESKVVFYPITILDDTRQGIWATGLPASVDIIVLGQEYVREGQTVNASNQAKGA